MRPTALFLGIAAAMLASCSVKEEIPTPVPEDVKFYATFEQPEDAATKVYANQDLCLRWDADDRVSIFNKLTYNQQYKFLGETGANSGEFAKVESAEFVTGNPLEHVVAFYPYSVLTTINEHETIECNFPAEQFYRPASFGQGANPMLSVSDDNVLQFMNVGGFLTFSLYGEGAVNSIVLEGNRDELISGRGQVFMNDGAPYVGMYYDPTNPSPQVVLTCGGAVALPSEASAAKEFWFVIPPTHFPYGFTITVNTTVGTFRKKTEKSIDIERNRISRMAPMKIEVSTSPDIEFADQNVAAICLDKWDRNGDGRLSMDEAAAVTDLGKTFYMEKNIVQFNELQYFTGLTEIAEEAFRSCESLTSVTLPASLKVIDKYAFVYCTALTGINLPEGLTTIDVSAFGACNSLGNVVFPASLTTLGQGAFSVTAFTSLEIPAGLTDIGRQAFDRIPDLTSIVVDPANPVYDSRDNCNALIETATNTLMRGCSTTVIPNTVTALSDYAFAGASGITSLNIPASVKKLGGGAFGECPDLESAYIPATVDSIGLSLLRVCPKLTSIVVDPANPKYDSRDNCNAIIETAKNMLLAPCATTVIPSTVTAIGNEAYGDNTFIVGHFDIPEGITGIGQVAFTGVKGLVSMTLPSTLQEMGILAIAFNPALTSVTCRAVTPPNIIAGQWIPPFQSEGPDFKIYVPAESVEEYKAAVGWSHHASIIYAIPE